MGRMVLGLGEDRLSPREALHLWEMNVLQGGRGL